MRTGSSSNGSVEGQPEVGLFGVVPGPKPSNGAAKAKKPKKPPVEAVLYAEAALNRPMRREYTYNPTIFMTLHLQHARLTP